MRFVTYNILDGGTGRESLIVEVLAHTDCDVIVLQEVADPTFIRQFGHERGYKCFVADGNHERRKIALLSRYAIVSSNSYHPFPLRRTLLEAAVEYAPQQRLSIFGVHLTAPSHLVPFEWWQLWELRVILKRVAAVHATPYIIVGDFNAIAPNEAVDVSVLPTRLRWLIYLQGGRIARRTITAMENAGLTDCYRLLHSHATGYTVPARAPNGRLDYIFVNEALRDMVCACAVVTEPSEMRTASDHLPVMMEMDL